MADIKPIHGPPIPTPDKLLLMTLGADVSYPLHTSLRSVTYVEIK